MEHAVEMRGILKIYPETGLRANDGIDLTLNKGEILCLAGENGAGKTTLMKILYGLVHPDAGSIAVMGSPASITSPLEANRRGIGMVHQHFMLVDEFTVAQNVTLGREPRKHLLAYDLKGASAKVATVIAKHHFSIAPEAKVGHLTVGQKQQVEIVKMLYRDVDILILDEPTSVLTEQETDSLFLTLRTLAASGKSLIVITHKLHEIKAISDRVAIMRQGKMVGEFFTDTLSEQDISRMMMGESVSLDVVKKPYTGIASPVLSFDHVSVLRRNQARPLLDDVSFTVHRGEIVGFAGVGGNGLGELEAVLSGTLPVSSGTIRHGDTDITNRHTHTARRNGLAYVPADRLKVGSALEATVAENLIVASRKRYSSHGILRRKMIHEKVQSLLDAYAVKGRPSMPIGTLSGGNIQKVILAREIEQFRDYIVFCEPTWGLDIASSRYVYERMVQLRDQGAAVILISSNLDEVLALSDRVIVCSRGSVVASLSGDELKRVTKEEMGAYMLGLARQEATCG